MPAGSLSIRTKIVGSVLLACGTFLVATAALVAGPIRDLETQQLRDELTRNARHLADEVARTPNGLESAAAIASRAGGLLERRVTVIARNGAVLGDSVLDKEHLGPHGDRPEIVAALATGTGTDLRLSASAGEPFLYVAARVERQGTTVGFVRVAMPLREVEAVTRRLSITILLAAGAAALLALPVGVVGARLATRKLVTVARTAEEIGRGELGQRIPLAGDDEVGRLAGSVNTLAERLEEKLIRLTRDRGLFMGVLDAIGEGLAFVDADDKVLAANGSFRVLVGAGAVVEGSRLRDLLPDPVLGEAVRRTIESGQETHAHSMLGEPARDVEFRVIPTPVANLGTLALVLTEDLSPNARLESLRLEVAAVLARSLDRLNLQLPREGMLALELSKSAALLDDPAPQAQVVLPGELFPGLRAADEAPGVYVSLARARAGIAMLRLELDLREGDQLPATVEVETVCVTVTVDLRPEPRSARLAALPRTSEPLVERLRLAARRLAIAHFEGAGAEAVAPGAGAPRKLIVRLPRA